MDPIALLAVIVGGIACFFGYRLITDAIRIWGFVILGAFAVLVATSALGLPGSLTQPSVQMIAVFVVAGVVGALIAGPLSVVIIFISGMALGAAIGEVGLPLIPGVRENMLITVTLALVTGVLAVGFQEITLIVTTSFVGAMMVAYGGSKLAVIEILPLVILSFVLGFFGAAAQYKNEHPDSSLMGR
jgi:hypothetical protein